MIFNSFNECISYLEKLLEKEIEINYYTLLMILKRNQIEINNTQFIDKDRYTNLSLVSISVMNEKSVDLVVNVKSWNEYLPEIYQDNEFLKRFLYGFQLSSMTQQGVIENISHLFDPSSTDFIDWLSSWFGITFNKRTDEGAKRKILSNAMKLYKKRGTKEYMEEMIEVLTGVDVTIEDDFHFSSHFDREKSEFKSNEFVVYISEKISNDKSKEYEKLDLIQSFIDKESPANTRGIIKYSFVEYKKQSDDSVIVNFNGELDNYDYDELDKN